MESQKVVSIQKHQLKLDLFSLDPLLDRNFSNTLEVYDIAGKYEYSKRRKYFRSATAEQTQLKRKTKYNGVDIQITITAANIERKSDGKRQRVFVFPGAREEVIEDVLRKIATENRSQAYQTVMGNNEGQKLVGLTFTLYEVYNELKRVGKSYSYNEIKEALNIMNKVSLTVESEDESIYLSAPLLPILAIKEKQKSFVCFHPMVKEAVQTLNFRRYNYLKSLQFKGHFARHLYKRLCHRWIQASPTKPYQILLSTLIETSKTPNKKLFKDKEIYTKTLQELIDKDVITHYEAIPKKEGRAISDWLFKLFATETFAKQAAANNKVMNKTREIPEYLKTV